MYCITTHLYVYQRGNMKHTTLTLYGIEPKLLVDMPYQEALIACKYGAKNRLQELMQYGYKERDEELIIAINKALHWCEAKLEEME